MLLLLQFPQNRQVANDHTWSLRAWVRNCSTAPERNVSHAAIITLISCCWSQYATYTELHSRKYLLLIIINIKIKFTYVVEMAKGGSGKLDNSSNKVIYLYMLEQVGFGWTDTFLTIFLNLQYIISASNITRKVVHLNVTILIKRFRRFYALQINYARLSTCFLTTKLFNFHLLDIKYSPNQTHS